METDVGQPEFTPPGLVSLNIVSSPLFGPPFTHLTFPLSAYFVGDVTPKDAVMLYVRTVLKLYDEYLQERDIRLPLIINTHGWVKGTMFTNSFTSSLSVITSLTHLITCVFYLNVCVLR